MFYLLISVKLSKRKTSLSLFNKKKTKSNGMNKEDFNVLNNCLITVYHMRMTSGVANSLIWAGIKSLSQLMRYNLCYKP